MAGKTNRGGGGRGGGSPPGRVSYMNLKEIVLCHHFSHQQKGMLLAR